MSDVENLKKENENLKNQLQANGKAFQDALMKLDAHKGELVDARTISIQLRVNLGYALKYNEGLEHQVKILKAQIEEMKKSKSDEVKSNKLESKQNKV